MPPPLTRRHVLGALGGTVITGGLASQVPVDSLDVVAPTPGTWPTGRYDPANTRANPHTSVPDDPTIDWQTTGLDGIGSLGENRLVVGVDHVYVVGNHLHALDKRDGREVWHQPLTDGSIAVHDGTVFHVENPEPDRDHSGLTVLDATTGTRRWRRDDAGGRLFLTANYVLVSYGGDGRGLTAFDRSDGSRAWSNEHSYHPLLASETHLYGDGLVKFDGPRRVVDVATDSGPPIAWQRDSPISGAAVLAAGRVIGSGYISASDGKRTPLMVAVDADSGNRVWESLRADRIDVSGATLDDKLGPMTPVVTGRRGFTSFMLQGEGTEGASLLSSISLADGAVRWHRKIEGAVTAMALADGQFLVSTQIGGTERRGVVHGVAPDDGRELWRVEFDDFVQRFVVCDGTIFAGLLDERVVALR